MSISNSVHSNLFFQSIQNDMVMQQSKMKTLKEVRSKKKSCKISDEMASKIRNLYEEWEKLSRTISANHLRLAERKELILKHVSKLTCQLVTLEMFHPQKFKEESFDYEKWRRRVSLIFFTIIVSHRILI